jgi:hypothetical protein
MTMFRRRLRILATTGLMFQSAAPSALVPPSCPLFESPDAPPLCA